MAARNGAYAGPAVPTSTAAAASPVRALALCACVLFLCCGSEVATRLVLLTDTSESYAAYLGRMVSGQLASTAWLADLVCLRSGPRSTRGVQEVAVNRGGARQPARAGRPGVQGSTS
jgi:hypothetical protein